jgi:tetratricopeptide (TPR) repeat protein
MLSRSSVVVASAVVLGATFPAHAAPPAPTPASEPGAAPSGSPAAAALVEPTAAQKQEARDELRRGNEHYSKERYEEALAAFRKSYAAVPSPNSRLMIGRSLLRLGRSDLAHEELSATMAEATERGSKYADARDAAQKELETLASQLAFLAVVVTDAPPGSLVSVGDRDIPVEQLPEQLPVLPGEITVVASGGGHTASETVTAAAGQSSTLTLSLAPPSEPEPEPVAPPAPAPAVELDTASTPLRTWAYVAGGLGVAGLATFGVFGLLNQNKFGELEDACPGNTCPADRQGDIDTGRTYQTIANVGLIVGAVGIATGVTLFVLSTGSTEQASGPSVRVAAGPGSVLMKGAF